MNCYRMDPLCSRYPARKSRNICEPRFEVKDFFEFLVRLLLGGQIVPGQSKNLLYLPLSALKFSGGQLPPIQVAHLFVQFFVGKKER